MVVMSGPAAHTVVYQLRVVLAEISPLIWRRLLVTEQTTLAELHEILQTAFGWTDAHLHQFVIHSEGGPWFARDARTVPLFRFGLRPGERFRYEYDFGDYWVHHLRVEAISISISGAPLPGVHRRGSRRTPGGLRRIVDFPGSTPRALPVGGHRAHGRAPRPFAGGRARHPRRSCCTRRGGRGPRGAAELAYWHRIDTFDRQAVNRALSGLSTCRKEPP
jgi:hypothetical protein